MARGLSDATQTSACTVSPPIILLTGLLGCGKTTLIKRVVQRLDHLRLALVRKLLENGSPVLVSVAMKGGGLISGGKAARRRRTDHRVDRQPRRTD